MDSYKVLTTQSLSGLGKREKADEILNSLCLWAQPIMRKRRWSVPLLAECNFKSPGVLGMNVNRGEKILIRLRRVGGSGEDFYEEETLMGTMLHELSHNVHSNHSAEFYKLMDELYKEYEDNRARNIKGSGAGFDAKGEKLNGLAHNPETLADAKHKALAAAEKRARMQELLGATSGPKTVGGRKVEAENELEAVRLATLRRCSDWCGMEGLHGGSDDHLALDGPQKKIKTADEEKVSLSSWVCTRCTVVNENPESASCFVCDTPQKPKPQQQQQQQQQLDPLSWSCSACTYQNDASVGICSMCESTREGWWVCPACTMANTSLFHCVACQAARPLMQ